MIHQTETIETIFDNFEKTVLETCDIWDTDYSSDNWEPEFMTIFGTWQLIVTLDSFLILAMFILQDGVKCKLGH